MVINMDIDERICYGYWIEQTWDNKNLEISQLTFVFSLGSVLISSQRQLIWSWSWCEWVALSWSLSLFLSFIELLFSDPSLVTFFRISGSTWNRRALVFNRSLLSFPSIRAPFSFGFPVIFWQISFLCFGLASFSRKENIKHFIWQLPQYVHPSSTTLQDQYCHPDSCCSPDCEAGRQYPEVSGRLALRQNLLTSYVLNSFEPKWRLCVHLFLPALFLLKARSLV